MEITAVAAQNVAIGNNILFTETPVASSNCSIMHRQGSGLVTLKGNTEQCRARYKIFFSGNLGVPTTETPDTTAIALSLNGEALGGATIYAPSMTAGDTVNVSTMAIVDVPKCCCATISVKNVGTVEALIQNANLIVERVA